jgi:hypothetical protein
MQIDMAGSDLASVHVPSFIVIEQSPTKKANQTGNSSARLSGETSWLKVTVIYKMTVTCLWKVFYTPDVSVSLRSAVVS